MVPREGFGWMNGKRAPAVVIFIAHSHVPAAYQVGLTYLSTGMRRAVSACTSPEVFFGSYANQQQIQQAYAAASNDPLGLAMDSLRLASPAMEPMVTSPTDVPETQSLH